MPERAEVTVPLAADGPFWVEVEFGPEDKTANSARTLQAAQEAFTAAIGRDGVQRVTLMTPTESAVWQKGRP